MDIPFQKDTNLLTNSQSGNVQFHLREHTTRYERRVAQSRAATRAALRFTKKIPLPLFFFLPLLSPRDKITDWSMSSGLE
jgi:hypothetical protein